MAGQGTKKTAAAGLNRRERQIMDIIYHKGKATVAEVMSGLPDPPGYSAVRALLRILENKGCLKHSTQGPRYVYSPVQARDKARRGALKHVMDTFFNNSAEQVMTALLDLSKTDLSEEELDRLSVLIEKARQEGR